MAQITTKIMIFLGSHYHIAGNRPDCKVDRQFYRSLLDFKSCITYI